MPSRVRANRVVNRAGAKKSAFTSRRSRGPLPFRPHRLRGAARRWSARHGLRPDLKHLADQHGRPAQACVGGCAYGGKLHPAVSAVSHVAHRNVDWRLFFRIVIPGMIGGVLGAYVLTAAPAEVARPVVLSYLTALGVYLFYRGIMHRHTERQPKIVAPLGLIGGFLDAAGGGGGARSSRRTCSSRAATRARRSARSTRPSFS